MTYTSIEQSKILTDLGLDANTADLKYVYKECRVINGCISNDWVLEIGKINDQSVYNEMPCWSAEALLDLIPKNLKSEGDYVCGYIELETGATNTDYTITYRTTLKGTLMFKTTGSLLDVLLKVIEWLLTNKFI